ncbi:MAG: DUF4342 domain-containing protein [Gemmatimonadales bacterium]|nr:MAG: DUF4342 domain-containing protein [Gemmatimonadales bacterium]
MTYADGEAAGAGGEQERERVHTTGDRLLETVKRIVREGNARRIVIRNDEDKVILEFPLTAGVVGAALLPVWAAVGAVAALVGNCSIEVERREERGAEGEEDTV